MVDKQSTLREMALFAGAGGGILGGHLLGWKTVCAVEWEPYPACVLAARQNDGILPPFPIWDDVQTFDGKPWRGIVDVVSGGFPCQDISSAGKGVGINGSRSSMWKHMARIIGEVRPRYAFVENSPLLVGRGLAVVISDLAEMGYVQKWLDLGATAVGMDSNRERLWLLAYPLRSERRQESHNGPNRRMGGQRKYVQRDGDWQGALREFRGVDDGLAYGVERTDAIRNGQIPSVAATAWSILNGT